MSQSPSTELASTWGRFATEQAAQTTRSKLEEAGIDSEKITLETDDFSIPIKLEDTGAIANLKAGAITGGVLGALIGLSISLIMTGFTEVGFAALGNFQPIHYFAPVMGAIVAAVGMSLILGISGASVPEADGDRGNYSESLKYSVVVQGTADELSLARETIASQGGVVEELDRR